MTSPRPSPAGKAVKPTLATRWQKRSAVAKATSWPAASSARASGTIWRCPWPGTQVNSHGNVAVTDDRHTQSATAG